MNIFEQKNAQLITEFDRYIIENPSYADSIPDGALVAMQVEGDDAFNEWSRAVAQKQTEKGQQVVYITIKKIRPVKSRIEELEITA
jgi:hypothetical protein